MPESTVGRSGRQASWNPRLRYTGLPTAPVTVVSTRRSSSRGPTRLKLEGGVPRQCERLRALTRPWPGHILRDSKARWLQSSRSRFPSGGSPCVSPTRCSSLLHSPPGPPHRRRRPRRRSISNSSRRAFSRSFSPSALVTRAALPVTVPGRRYGSSRWRPGERPGLTRSRARTSMPFGGWSYREAQRVGC